MSVQISQEQLYINAVMAKLPDVEHKKEHILKKGESLWSIAKQSLHKNASNQEISTLMLLIAKMNGLTTVEKMNNLKAAQKIYLPDGIDDSVKDGKRGLNPAERTALSVLHTLQNDKNLIVQDPFFYWKPGSLYHIYNKLRYPSGFVSHRHPVTSVNMGKDGTISTLTFNDTEKHFNPWGYDYELQKDGTLINRYTHKQCGQLSKEQMQELLSTCENVIQSSQKNN